MELDTLHTVIGIGIGASTIIGGVVWWGRKKLWHPAKAWFIGVNHAVKELVPNGGNSIKDAITRIDRQVDSNAARSIAIMSLMPQGIYECDIEGRCTSANHSICEMFGLDYSQMLGNGWLAAVEPDDRDRVLSVWLNAVAKAIPYESSYVVVNQRDHTSKRYKTSAKPMIGSKGNILGYYGVIEPVD